jgi:hypothetical protein
MPPNQKVDANAATRASFGKNSAKREFESALIYKLQRSGSFESNVDDASIGDTSTSPHLLVIWRFDDRAEYSVHALLIENSNTITWDENELKKLDYPPVSLLRDSCVIKNTWLLDNTTVLTASKWEKRTRTIEITISKGNGEKSCTKLPYSSSDM